MRMCLVHRLGMIEYEAAWSLQNTLADEIAREARPPTLLLLEHPHIYTFGRRGHEEFLLWDEAERLRRDVKVLWVDRGGDVTYHGPGQLVGYPLLPLAAGGLSVDSSGGSPRLPQADYVGYLRRLEQTLILALSWLGVAAFQVEGKTGVWVDRGDFVMESPSASAKSYQKLEDYSPLSPLASLPSKIAAIGVKVDARGVSRHGFALNVNPDMDYWQGIVGCGLVGYPVACLAEIMASPPDMETVIQAVIKAFSKTFDYEMNEEVL